MYWKFTVFLIFNRSHHWWNYKSARLKSGRSMGTSCSSHVTTKLVFPASLLRSKSKDWLTRNQDVSKWSDVSNRRLLFQWASTIKIQLTALVWYYVWVPLYDHNYSEFHADLWYAGQTIGNWYSAVIMINSWTFLLMWKTKTEKMCKLRL